MRLLFVLPRIVSGGVERVTLNLIRQFVADGIECKLALRLAHGEFLHEALSLVSVEEIAPKGLHQFIPGLSRVIRTWQPTHVITAFSDVAMMTWIAMRLVKCEARWVHGVHNTHDPIIARGGILGRLRHVLENRIAGFIYRHADTTVTVSEGVRGEVLTMSRVEPSRVVTIYNPVVSERQLIPMTGQRHSSAVGFSIVALGRLARQKGFDVLIRAMNRVPQPWHLEIWGDGPDRELLDELIHAQGLQESISLRGHTDTPFDVLRTADLFVLPSRHEGLPTVLVEALACQCQIVATDCLHGPKEILEDGRLGQLVRVEDANSLALAISDALSGKSLVEPELLLKRAHDFTIDRAYRIWSTLLQENDMESDQAARV